MKIYWYPIIDDYVFIYACYGYALSDTGKTWYAQIYTRDFEFICEVV